MRPVLALLAIAALASGCSEALGSSVDQAVLTEANAQAAQGTRTATLTCDGSGGQIVHSVSARTGSVRFTVVDAAGRTVADTGAMSGDSNSVQQGFSGTPGTWTLKADRLAFTGSYSAIVQCV